MCRWMTYSGEPVLADDLLFRPVHSLIDQALHSKLGATTTNGDGFGIGWYGEGDVPALFKSTEPAWNDENLRELAGQIRTGLLFAHIRASTGTPVQRSNCHPFRHGTWMWMHNGGITGFPTIKRELVGAVAPELYPHIEGSTDSEVLFYLALTFGLRDDPPAAVERAVGLVEEVAAGAGIRHPVQMTVATADGSTTWAFRYSSVGRSRSLYHSTHIGQLRRMHPEVPVFGTLPDTARLIVSEPLRDMPDAWAEVPESCWGMITEDGRGEQHAFAPRRP
ncbi:glutamine amidotransferase [Georgenia soli]|uniref:Glutamine amidotransferase n=1 Tax=Georgenia soli TaxID=638953 RepID=A0A2A9ERP0_9MICO|nr:class II glutamine amidotransferase [Georgenia soli]PFG40932.1 glutamine amidotransferase [Georgenia soli]